MAVYQSLSVTQVSQNTQENSSQVRILWQSTQTGSSYNLVERTASYWVSVNGQTEEEYSVSYTLPLQSTETIVDTVLTVPHNDKGEASVQVRTWMNTRISAGVVELSQTLYPDKIPRASTLQASDGVIGGYSRLAVAKKNSAYTHSIVYSFGSISGYVTEEGSTSEEEVRFAKDSVDFVIPEAFYDAIPNAKSGQCLLLIRTYFGTEQIGMLQMAVFTVTASESICKPDVSGTVEDTNPVTLALTGDKEVLVRYYSNALCTISAAAKNRATITKRLIHGAAVLGNTLEIPNAELASVQFTAQDSRGYCVSYTEQVELIPYVKLSCDAVAERDDPVSGNATVYLSGDYFNGSFGATDNSLEATCSIDGGDEFPVEVTVTADNRFYAAAALTGMDYTRVYSITVRVSDKLTTVEKQTVLKKGVPVFDWGEEDFAFHVPVQMDSPLSIANGGTGAADTETAWTNLGLTLPMTPNVEYATWERWNGKTVYTKSVEFGAMPNNACTGVYHLARAARILRCCGSMSDGRTLPYGGSHSSRAEVFCDAQKVYIDTGSDCSALSATVQIWYIKE